MLAFETSHSTREVPISCVGRQGWIFLELQLYTKTIFEKLMDLIRDKMHFPLILSELAGQTGQFVNGMYYM